MNKVSPLTELNERTFRFISFALIAAMLTCAALTLLSLIDRVLPDWQPRYLTGLVFFAAFERLYTHRSYNSLSLFSKPWLLAVSTEWVVIIFIVKVAVGFSHGAAEFWAEIQQWLSAFPESFLRIDFLFALGLVILAWFVSGAFAGLIDEMGLQQTLIRESLPVTENAAPPARDRLLSLIMTLGTYLVILAALVRVDLRAFFAHTGQVIFTQLPALAGGGGSTLLYFMLGLVLLSQTQFIDLHTRWSLQNIPIRGGLAWRWAFYGLIFFGLLALVVSFLPTSYSLGLLNMLGNVIDFFANLLFLIGQALFYLLFLVLSLPFMLLGLKSPFQGKPPSLPKFVPSAGGPAPNPGSAAWLELAKTAVFWVVLGFIIVFSIVQYVRQHEQILQALRKMAAKSRLDSFWLWLKGLYAGLRTGIKRVVALASLSLPARPAGATSPPGLGLAGLHRLDPRQRITFFYLAFLRRGAESGLVRGISQTPNEYAARVDVALPEVVPEIDSLTGAFVEARYSAHTVEPAKVSLVKEYWNRIRQALRGKSARN